MLTNRSQDVDMLRAALDLAGRGLRVVPLHHPIPTGCSCGRPRCPTPAKHPLWFGWQRTATTDSTFITLAWERTPNANIGALTAHKAVIDVDPRNGGDETMRDIYAEHGDDWAHTWTSRTGGGGLHLFFGLPAGETIVGGAHKLGPGVDVKTGDGSLSVLPPSLHASGWRYNWRVSPADVPLAPLPDWMRQRLRSTPAKAELDVTGVKAGAADGDSGLRATLLGRALKQCRHGGRHDAALWLACQLRDCRFSRHAAQSALAAFAVRAPVGDHAFTSVEAGACVESAYSRPPRKAWASTRRVPVFRGGRLEFVTHTDVTNTISDPRNLRWPTLTPTDSVDCNGLGSRGLR